MASSASSASKGSSTRAEPVDPAATLFVCLFAVQAAVIALSPVLPAVAADFGVSTAAAGQLRTLAGLVAGLTAISIGRLTALLGLRELMLAGLATLAAGSLASAAAPSFAVLAAAQVLVGVGMAVVLSGGLAAAAEWADPGRRAHALSWALLGQPFAWIAGMPAIGLLGTVSWRWGWVAVPLLASLVALVAVARRQAEPHREPADGTWQLLADSPRVAAWAVGELCAWAAWGGTLVYSGALFVETYDLSTATAGLLLGLAAVAYFPGNLVARRHVDRSARLLVATLPPLAAALVALLGAVRPSAAFSVAVFALLTTVSAGRTIAGSALGLEVCAHRRVFAMRIRTAATQFGYLLGAAIGGVALSAGGYPAVGGAFAALFALSALPHLLTPPRVP